LKKTIKLKNH